MEFADTEHNDEELLDLLTETEANPMSKNGVKFGNKMNEVLSA